MASVLILRPQPGADASAARARALGLEPVAAPLFTVRPVAWDAPDPAGFDAVVMTSANAARHAGPQLAAFLHLPCYVVGETTGAAAARAGFTDIRVGEADSVALAELMQLEGVRSALHLTGAVHVWTDVMTAQRIVYESEAAETLPAEAEGALAAGALVLLHSPRAASTFARLWRGKREDISLAAISEAAARAAGSGWKSVAWPDRPRDQALLELAARLCKNERKNGPSRGA